MLKKLLWDHHPTRRTLHKQKRHPSPMCPLCSEEDDDEHFLYCETVNNSPKYKVLVNGLRHKAHKNNIPDHLINTITTAMTGVTKSPRRQQEDRRRSYVAQQEIGWKHFHKGRIAKEWGTADRVRGQAQSPAALRTEIASILLRWIREKWRIRCGMSTEIERTEEKARLVGECRKLWEERARIRVLPKDRDLFDTTCSPSPRQSLDYLSAWLETRQLAIQEYGQYKPSRNQTSILRWLQPER